MGPGPGPAPHPPPPRVQWLLRVLLTITITTSTTLWGCDALEFTRLSYNASVPENAVGKTYVTGSEKMGLFVSDPSLVVRYRIASGDPDKLFKAEALQVGDFCFLLLRTRTEEQAVLNREYRDEYLLGVRATVTSRHRRTVKLKAQTEVRVRVLDTNDLNPLFYPVDYSAIVPEDQPLHKPILAVSATDPDLGPNGEIYYSLRELSVQFAVHPTAGFLFLTRPLNRAAGITHELTVLAEDRGPKFRAADFRAAALVRLEVSAVNLHAPDIAARPLSNIPARPPELLAVVRVTDKDRGLAGRVENLEIVAGDPGGLFRVEAGEASGEFDLRPAEVDHDLPPGDYTLTLRATDAGSPSRSATQVLRLRVSEASRPAPKFVQSDYDVEVEEAAPAGYPLVRLRALVNGALASATVYAVESGNDAGTFVVNPRSGLLSSARPLDREERAYYSLTVSATDSGRRPTAGLVRKGTAIVNVRVLDNNDNDPVFNATSFTVSVDENRARGSHVCTVHASDRDKDDNGYVTYSLANLRPVPFAVDHFTGEIRTTEVLDYETMRREYMLRVRASDWGSPYRRQAETTIRVKVRDVNDHRPLFERVDCVVQLPDSTPAGAEILTLSALDFDAGSIVHYLAVPSPDDPCFRLDPATGVLALACDLTQRHRSEWMLNVSATDGQHFADVTSVRVKLLREGSPSRRRMSVDCRDLGVAEKHARQIQLGNLRNKADNISDEPPSTSSTRFGDNRHAPEFLSTLPSEVWINESAPVGTEVLAVRARDRDHGYAGLLVYVLGGSVDEEDDCFRLDLYTGRLLVDAPLDRERRASYSLNATVRDLGRPPRTASLRLTVRVRDANDHAPVFERAEYRFAVPEDVAPGASLVRLRAADADEGLNAAVHYGLESEGDRFRVDPDTGLLTVAQPLDREDRESYALRVWARDSSPDRPLTAWTTVHVRLEDVNDNAPSFGLTQTWVKVREDLPPGSVIAVVSAHDPDLGDGGLVSYEADGEDVFAVDPITGTVRLARPLDFEQKQLYNVSVRARDRGRPPLASAATLMIEVEDVDENRHSPRFPEPVAAGRVTENAPEGTLVMRVTATDADPTGPDSTITYSIRDGDGLGLFDIDDQGQIRTLAVLDRESGASYWLTVVARDRGAVPLSCRLDVYVAVDDENDNAPLTLEPAYYPGVPEGAPQGTRVLQLDAFDPDHSSTPLTFHISAGDPQGHFHIDPDTGLITTTSRLLDREAQAEHVLEVTVSDSGEPPLSSTTRVVVRVIDVNDHEPAFFQRLQRCYVAVAEKPGPTLCQVLASDADAGPNGDITYAIEGPNVPHFRIHPKTGAIYSQGPLHSGQQFELMVSATDGGKPALGTSARVIVEVWPLPHSEGSSPVIRSPPESQIVVSESDPVGHLVALVQAEDPDRDRIWFAITGGNVGDVFMIQSDGGALLLARKLKWEVHNNYNLTLSITDGVFTVFTTLCVRVMSINNHAPEFLEHSYQVDISENSPVDTEILKLDAVDRDRDHRLIYTVHNSASPHSLSKFRLDSRSGVLSLAQPLDHETAQRHVLTVAVTDSGTPARRRFTRVEVTVHDHNDHAPRFLGGPLVEARVFETAALGTAVVQLVAVDRDKGRNAQIAYSIVSGNVGQAFSVDRELGIVRVVRTLDRRTMAEYFLTARAEDRGSPSLNTSLAVHVAVTVADNAAPRFDHAEYAAEVPENGRPGSRVAAVHAASRSAVFYEIATGDPEGLFAVNPSSGVVRATRPLDFEAGRFHNLSLRATNMAGARATASLLVHVLDRNDHRPVFVRHHLAGRVGELADADTLVLDEDTSAPLVATAKDADSGPNSLLRYAIVEKRAQLYFKIDASTGAISTAQGLDHEKFSNMSFTVQAWDSGRPRLSSLEPATVIVQVTDANDCPPRFEHPSYAATLLLPTFRGVALLQVRATDPDLVATASLTYHIVSGDEAERFSIDQDSGLISVRGHEDLREEYQLVVSASDSEFEASTKVAIKVRDPESPLHFSLPKYEARVQENSSTVDTVAVVSPVGLALNEHVTFAILNPSNMFQIGPTSGAIRTKGVPFDREAESSYTLVVEARRDVAQISHVLVEVDVLDVNDNAPVFVNLPYYSVVPTEAEQGYVVRKVHAIDLDMGENGRVHYELVEGDNQTFRVDRKTGEIVLLRSVGSHKLDHRLVVAAIDAGTPSLRSTTEVPIRLINRDMPVFPKHFYNVSVAESLPAKSAVLTVLADSPEGRQLIYSIVEGNVQEDFGVDFNTDPGHNNGPCILYVVEALDYERTQEYRLSVRATDSVSGAFADVLVHVRVEDVNDNAPSFELPVYAASVSEAAPFGTPVLRVRAMDRDSGRNRRVQYFIAGNASSHFHVESAEGIVFLKRPLDRELQAAHRFVVTAADAGSPSLSATALVTVDVLDLNDNAPHFEHPAYQCTLGEGAPRGHFVTRVTAQDPDATDRLAYALVGGDEQQAFTIDPTSGIITLSNLHQFTNQSVYSLNVSVTDGVYSSYTRVRVDVLGENNHSPAFTRTVYEVTIQENLPPGVPVTTVKARDVDRGEYGKITYSIESQLYGKIFFIDPETGILYTSVSFDREKHNLYEVPVAAFDGGGRPGYSTVRITITNDNDNAPMFPVADYRAYVYENTSVGTTVLQVHAVDEDDDVNAASVEYSIYASNTSTITELFGISKDQGEVYIKKSLAKFAQQTFQFFVRARDRGSPAQESEVPVNVVVVDSSVVVPRFERQSYEFFVSERSPIGTAVSTLNASSTEPISYGFAPAPQDSVAELHQSMFSISEQGRILLNSALDREATSLYQLAMRAQTSLSPTLMAFCDVTIHVMDENDNVPVFESNPYGANVAENVQKGTSILKVVAHDADAGANSEVRYSFGPDVGNAANVFHLDPKTGWITTLTALDHETVSRYNFTVIARDQGHPALSSSTVIVIQVRDYNDNPPVFERPRYEAAIYEDAAPRTDIITLETRDADFESSPVQFYIIGGNPLSQFHVHQTGEIYVNKPLDREHIASYLLEVLVTDGLFVAKTKVALDVLDANDNPPVCMKTQYSEWISEAVPPNTYVLTVEATDADDGRNALQLYSLSGPGAEELFIDSSTGVIKTAQHLDRERRPRYLLVARVQDRDNPEWSCEATVEIMLEDVNDNAPRFTPGPAFSAALPEDAPLGTLVAKVHALDEDLGASRKIRYSLVDSAGGHFSIDERTGIVRLRKALDRESQPAFNLSVRATDSGEPLLEALAPLVITVLDINDNPPEFTNKVLHTVLSELALPGTEIIAVQATSRDIGINAEISYAIVGGDEQEVFRLAPKSGVITVAKPLNYETVREYFLTIQAVDGGAPPLSSQAVVNVSLTDANDNSPVFSQPSYRAIVKEDATTGSQVIQVVASDADSGINAHLSFAITSGDSGGQFFIDAATGLIKVASPLDREMIPSYILHVTCTDSGSPQLSSAAMVNIEVSDVNDNAPLFSQNNYTAIVQEGKPVGYTVLKFNIIDADAPPNTGPFTLTISSGNVDGAFRLVQQDATLRTAIKFDHKKRNQYPLHVQVTDNGIPALSSDVWVTVLVIEESQFPPIISALDVTINSFLDDFPGGVMGRIHATDQDPYDELHYDIVTPYKDLFSVDHEDGTMIALPGLDVGTYNINVSVADGKFTSYGTVSVEVNMVTEEAVKNSVGLRLKNVTPEDFILSHRRSFLLGIRSVLNVRIKDVDLLSVQPASSDESKEKRSTSQDLDVLFAVRKAPHIFYPAKQIWVKLKEKQTLLETTSGLKVVKIMKNRCSPDHCMHGDCVDRVIFDEIYVVSVTTESMSYVAPQHIRKLECLCEPGFGGAFCDDAINECARKPCSTHHICYPDPSDLGYICQCPPGKTGTTCDRDKAKVCQGTNCYEEKNPVSYNGRSYGRYSLTNPVERHLSVVVNVRTVQATGNLMYAAGTRDYSILEIMNGFVQYRFDCGSGEGLVRVDHSSVNDGAWHEVGVERRGNTAEVTVDARHRASGHAPGVHDILNLDGNDVYFGAEVRHHPPIYEYEDIRMGFVGCMDDIRLDGAPLPLHASTAGNTGVILQRFANVEFQCSVLFDPGICGSQPCVNGGSCRAIGNSFTCQCLPRFLGSRCEIDTNPCASSPCLNGASCHNLNNSFRCDCPEGLSGKRCGYGRYCNPNPCHNNGICEEGTYSALCKCHGFYGELCQYDINECQANPCGNGATCRNIEGSFHCQCPSNTTGILCTETLYTNSITSTKWNTTVEELVGIAVVVVFIMLMAIALACCWRIRHKVQRRQRRPGLPLCDDPAANEFMLKNSIIEKDNVKRLSKLSNVEVTFTTPPLPPRPASYTPSTQESLNVLSKFDTVRSYGSAADDLEGAPQYGSGLFQNFNKAPPVSVRPSLTPPPPSNSDSDSLLKAGWEADLNSSKDKIYEEKIQNNLNPGSTDSSLEKVKCQKVLPSAVVSSIHSLSSVEDLSEDGDGECKKTNAPGYHWDISDWATSQKALGSNFIDISQKEAQDSSSIQSTDSNSFVSQIELLPADVGGKDEMSHKNIPCEALTSDYPSDHKLTRSNVVNNDERDSQIYQFSPETYLPPPSFANPQAEPWTEFTNDDIKMYGFPSQGGRGFRVALESGDYGDVNASAISLDELDSKNASVSDISAKVCELEDSETNASDIETNLPVLPKNYDLKPSYV